MNLHYETVSPLLKETLQKLVNSPIFKDFTLIGGTCLSLQLGHRRSIDIDLFTDIDYGTMNTKEMKEFIQRSFPYSENTDSLDTSALGYTLYMGDSPIDKIKVDFFYTEKFIFPIQEIDHIRFPICPGVILSELSSSFRSNSLGVFDKEFRDCFRCVFSIVIRISLVPYTKPINIKKAEGHSPIRKRGSPSPIHTNRRYPPHITGSIYLFLCV